MLPAEKSERWVRRILMAVLLLLALYLLIWVISFISRVFGRVLEQRQAPPEAWLGPAETA